MSGKFSLQIPLITSDERYNQRFSAQSAGALNDNL
jgi:hypothetical protein